MQTLTLPKGYPYNRYSLRETLRNVADVTSIKATLRYGRGGRATAEQFELSTEKTPGASSTDAVLIREEGFTMGTYWLEISADSQVVRAGLLIITYDH